MSPFDTFTSPDWMRDALCAQVGNPDAFFPNKGGDRGAEAKDVCALCPVRDQCLEYALDHHETFGIWGGVGERARRRLASGGAA